MNFEGNICGEPYGTQTTSAPVELIRSLRACGVDLLQMANSCAINNGLNGLTATLNAIRSAGIEPMGAYATAGELRNSKGYTITDVQGVKVAFVAFTKGLGGRGMPAGNENLVNLLYTDYATNYQKIAEKEIKQILKNVEAQQPDVTIALLHWGSTYNDILRDSQKKIEKLMLENGVDAIIGTHSHYVQEVKFDPEAGTVVAYSLGDFFSGGQQNGSHYSILLQLEVTRNNLTGETKITACDYVPVYTLTPERDGESMRLVRIEAAIEQYENRHINRVNSTAYQNLLDALERIRSRVGF
jgi:poly-gamma-glutamate synthesis protein (capsule biosynthesis protein)